LTFVGDANLLCNDFPLNGESNVVLVVFMKYLGVAAGLPSSEDAACLLSSLSDEFSGVFFLPGMFFTGI
jgi:hypothetical protein